MLNIELTRRWASSEIFILNIQNYVVMFLIDNITKIISKWKETRIASKALEHKQYAEQEALIRFNISSFDGKPVIIYGDVVISIPNDKTTGDSLIQTMLKLREIYVQSKCNNGQKA